MPILESITLGFLSWRAIGKFAAKKSADVAKDQLSSLAKKKAMELFKEWFEDLSIPENNDLFRAVRRSCVQATLILCEARLREISKLEKSEQKELSEEKSFVENLKGHYQSELKRLRTTEYVLPLDETLAAILTSTSSKPGEEPEKIFRRAIKKQLLDELASLRSIQQNSGIGLATVAIPARLTEMVEEGWTGPESSRRDLKIDWFDLVTRFFAQEIEQDEKIARILQNKLQLEQKEAAEDLKLDLRAAILSLGAEIHQQLAQLDTQLFVAVQRALNEIRRLPYFEEIAREEIRIRVDESIDTLSAIFAGRGEELEKIDKFIGWEKSGVLTISAPAGHGKSALLANWIRNHQESGDVFIAYHFFSNRDDLTSNLGNGLFNLLRQLYVYYLVEKHEQIPSDENRLKLALANLIRRHGIHDGERLIIVLDGLDEADREFSPLFSKALPHGVYVIASWREGTEQSYHALKDWQQNSLPLNLGCLDEAGIGDWLQKSGNEVLEQASEDQSNLRLLKERTDGLPLYLTYLIDELCEKASSVEEIGHLMASIPNGFSAYVRQQYERMKMPKEKGSQKLFHYLAVAFGSISAKELRALTGLTTSDFNNLPVNITRWFTVSQREGESLYSFAHPMLANEFKKAMEEDTDRALGELLGYCAEWKNNQSRYALLYYTRHLSETGRWEEIYSLARNRGFLAQQRNTFFDFPELPLQTIQTALRAAINEDKGSLIAEFLLRHAYLATHLKTESPLAALNQGSYERALKLVDQLDADR